MNYIKHIALSSLIFFLSSCKEESTTIGLYDEHDGIENVYSLFDVITESAQMPHIIYSGTRSYLGNITDPETDTEIRANFAAQFHTFESYKFPSAASITAAIGKDVPEVDSVEVRLYFDNYIGDKNNPLKLEVFPLSKENIMKEDTTYYTDTDLEYFADMTKGPIATKMITPRDYIFSDNFVTTDSYTDNIRIPLSSELGNEMLSAYYADPSCYSDSYQFVHKVFPGLYFRISNGSGTLLRVNVGTMNMYFRYKDENTDSIIDAVARFAATPEVIQSTRFYNGDLSSLMAEDTCTFLKTPAGICTEMTLPINSIYKGHENDSISKAQVTLTRYISKTSGNYSMEIPQSLLMVRKDDAEKFFKEHKVSNGQTSYTTSYNSGYNTYTFDNVGRLLAYCQAEKKNGMNKESLTAEEWEAAHPNWNKVYIIPVEISTTTDSYGNKVESKVINDLTLCSTRLVKGTEKDSPIKLQVVYSRFKF